MEASAPLQANKWTVPKFFNERSIINNIQYHMAGWYLN